MLPFAYFIIRGWYLLTMSVGQARRKGKGKKNQLRIIGELLANEALNCAAWGSR